MKEENFTQAAKIAAALRAEVAKAMVGQRDVIDAVLCALLAGGHVLVEGVPGLGKTLLVRALARSIPVTSAGMRSGVNWMRPNVPEMLRARARTRSVLPRPGTPSTRTWPPASSAHSTASITSRCPTIALATSARRAAAIFAAWVKFSSFIAQYPCSFLLVASFQCAVDALGGVHGANE